MALHKPARNTKQACTRDLQSTCTDPDDCADGISLLKYSILKLSKIDVSEEVNSVNKSKPELTRPPSINDLSLQACQDGKLKGFEPTMCNTYQTCAEATLKPSCDSQKSSLMVISYNNLGLLHTISCWKLFVYLGGKAVAVLLLDS